MKNKFLRRAACIFVFILLICSLTSCSKLKSVFNSLTGNEEESEKTETGNSPSKSGNTEKTGETLSDSDYLFSVNGQNVTYGEWNLYARPRYEETRSLFSDEIWKYDVNSEGKKFSEAFLEDVRDEICYTKIVASQAEELGIELTDDDNIEINIETADYLSRLSSELQSEYRISENDIRKVLTDNLLALKVYENLTLNISTDTDEKEVRHMVLQYVMIPKTYENKSGDTEFYSDSELDVLRTRLRNLREYVASHYPMTLKESETQDFVAVEMVADLAQLQEQLPEDLAGVAFWLREGEVSEIYETEDAIFLFDCAKETDAETTNAAKIEVLERREKEVFEQAYNGWKQTAVIEINDENWKKLKETY